MREPTESHSRIQAGGIKGKGKKNGSAMTGSGTQSHNHGKLKKGSQFKALHKQRCVSTS